MTSKPIVQVVTAVVILVFAAGILATGGSADLGWLRFYSIAVSAAVIVLALWDRWLWRFKPVQKFKAVPRDIRGTWQGTLTRLVVDPSLGELPASKPAFLVIRQTWSSVSIVMITDESRSRSALAKVSAGDGVASLDYSYLNSPDSRFEQQSRMHHGSTSLDISGTPARRLRGRYWTDRRSRGELDFTLRVTGLAEDYESACDLFG